MNGVLSRLSLEQWQQTVEACPESMAFHHRNWLELLGRQYGFAPHIFALVEQGRVLAAIPFLQTGGLLGRRKLVSLPFSDCVPLLPAMPGAVESLCCLIRAEESANYQAVLVRSDRPLVQTTSVSQQVRHVLPTNRPWKDVQAGFHKGILCNIRQAESHGLRFEWRTDAEAMESFYRLQLATRKKLGVPIQPRGYFRLLHEWMVRPGLAFVGLVTRRGRPVGAAVFLSYKQTLLYKHSASDPQALEFRPNDLLAFHAVRRAVEENKACLDLGSSDKVQEGLRHFKRKWGAMESEIHYACISGTSRDSLRHSLPFRASSFAIRHSPAIVCRCLGEALYRYSQ
jgi:hypothetical protein